MTDSVSEERIDRKLLEDTLWFKQKLMWRNNTDRQICVHCRMMTTMTGTGKIRD